MSLKKVRVAIIDDHILFRRGLISLIEMVSPYCEIILESDNGIDLTTKFNPDNCPDLFIVDINMPTMGGFETVEWINKFCPEAKVLVISMVQKEETIVKMLKLGVRGYLGKDVEPKELGEAIQAIISKGFYYTDFLTGKLIHSLQRGEAPNSGNDVLLANLNERELTFIKLACTEKTYNEIASEMYLSPKTIDGYRNALFEKFNVKSRVGLALFAVKNGIVRI